MSVPPPPTPPFSVLLPVYAGDVPEHLVAAFRSVTSEQALPPDELVLVRDGALPPALDEVARELVASSSVPVVVVELPANVGLGLALTAGLERCRHRYVARMDADDVSRPERFARQLPLLAAGLDLVGSAIEEFDVDPSSPQRRRPVLEDPAEIVLQARLRSPFNHPSVVFDADVVRAAGGYQDLAMMEDYWLWARLIVGGARVGNVDEPLLLYRVGAGAYARRGGWTQLRSELALQRAFRRIGFTTRRQLLRNLLVRGGYRVVPEAVRRGAYRLVFARRALPQAPPR